jgi:hypothetical protein
MRRPSRGSSKSVRTRPRFVFRAPGRLRAARRGARDQKSATWYWDRALARESSLVRAMRCRLVQRARAPPRSMSGVVSIPRRSSCASTARLVFDAVLARSRAKRRLEPGDVLHLWFHPHNAGANVDRSLERLARTFDAIDRRAPSRRYASMGDLVDA